MRGDAHADQPELQPTCYLAWEEKQRLLAFKAEGLVKGLPETPAHITVYAWTPGELLDITCAGCQSIGCNRCAGRATKARATLEPEGLNPTGYMDRLLCATLSRVRAALGLPRGRSTGDV